MYKTENHEKNKNPEQYKIDSLLLTLELSLEVKKKQIQEAEAVAKSFKAKFEQSQFELQTTRERLNAEILTLQEKLRKMGLK